MKRQRKRDNQEWTIQSKTKHTTPPEQVENPIRNTVETKNVDILTQVQQIAHSHNSYKLKRSPCLLS